ncbi:hypothetical protein FGL74_00425 [Leuconostoc koreense]|nr:hypothetical protein FGL74_00425 [Leuconostoc mesenteroides]QGM25781.1 hypothetical protein GJV51_07270 [Leuconostoc mesenteroides subsp. mesenteroides]
MEDKTTPEFKMIYKDIEKEVIDLSYKITFDETQKNVYSTFIAELELRIFALIESVAKFYGSEKQGDQYDYFFGKLYVSEKNRPHVLVTMSGYKLNKKDYSDVFEKKEDKVIMVDKERKVHYDPKGNNNWKYNNAYQNLRHNFVDSLPIYGTLEYLLESLAVLFVVLDTKDSQIFSTYEFTDDGRKSYWHYQGSGMAVRKSE